MEKHIDAEKLVAELTKMQFTLNAAYRKPQSDNIVRAISLEYDDILSLIESLQQEQDLIIINKKDWEAQEQFRKNKVFGKPLQQEQPNHPDFDPNHYTKVRETKTGRVFWAEYSSEAAEWYEAGTGKAYSISDVEVVKEQPEVDLEKEIIRYKVPFSDDKEYLNETTLDSIARHFYELGLRRAAEMYDDIEYNRQRVEEEPDKSLEEEMKCFINAHYHTRFDETLENGNDPLTVFDFEDIARHFAEWGAEHLRDTTKMMDKSLEEEISRTYHDGSVTDTEDIDHVAYENIAHHFAEWQASRMPMPEDTVLFQKGVAEGRRLEREDMLKGAVEGRVFMSFAPGHNQMVMADVDLPTNTKVRIVVLKEEEE